VKTLQTSRCEAAKRFGVHRNTITKMLSFSVPPGYRRRERPASKKLGPYMAWIDAILEGDRRVHKKQRYTAHRIFEQLRDERGFTGGYTIVREYVAQAMLRTREMFVPLSHRPGHAQADFGEADGYIGGKKVRCHYFCMNLPFTGYDLDSIRGLRNFGVEAPEQGRNKLTLHMSESVCYVHILFLRVMSNATAIEWDGCDLEPGDWLHQG
jgi:transposase